MYCRCYATIVRKNSRFGNGRKHVNNIRTIARQSSITKREVLLEAVFSVESAPRLYCSFYTLFGSDSESYVTTTGSRPVCVGIKHSSGDHDQIFITERVCWCGAFSLTRAQICNLEYLLSLASAVILWFQYSGNRDHILQSHIRAFPCPRLLRLVGTRWRYSASPPHGVTNLILFCTTCTVSRRSHRKYIRCPAIDICGPHRKHFLLYCYIYSAFHSNGSYSIIARVFVAAGMCLPSRCLAVSLHFTILFRSNWHTGRLVSYCVKHHAMKW
jgi:hypothetical protein